MTLREFNEFTEDASFWDLIDFCQEHDLYYVSDGYYGDDSFSDRIWDIIHDWDDTWEYLRSFLDELPSGYDIYYEDDYGEWEGLSEREAVERIADKIRDAMQGDWDDEDDDDDPYVDELDDQQEEDDEEECYVEPMTADIVDNIFSKSLQILSDALCTDKDDVKSLLSI